jgi:hypothetical protein
VLPLLDSHSFSFLIEDPATVWNLGPRRYAEIAKRYRALTPHPEKLAMDINITDRYQDVYPTKQQTGVELFELVHMASVAFPRVALYFENSILRPDLPLLAAASAPVKSIVKEGSRTTVEAGSDVEIACQGAAMVDGKAWPLESNGYIRLPGGRHVVEAAQEAHSIRVLDLNARLIDAGIEGGRIALEYESDSRAVARFDRRPADMTVDGAPFGARCEGAGECAVLLPRGRHRIEAQ